MTKIDHPRPLLLAQIMAVFSLVLVILGIVEIRRQMTSLEIGGQVAFLVAWLLLLIAFVNLRRSQRLQEQQMLDRFALELKTARDEGYTAGYRGLARKFVSESDVLSLVQTYVSTSSPTDEPNIREGNRILEQVLWEFRRFADLQPITSETEVRFDPKQHRAREQLKLGEPAVVVEPGWLLASEMVKMPIVRRRHQQT